jgi:hypothetical protein
MCEKHGSLGAITLQTRLCSAELGTVIVTETAVHLSTHSFLQTGTVLAACMTASLGVQLCSVT